jgi:hypothetical protein
MNHSLPQPAIQPVRKMRVGTRSRRAAVSLCVVPCGAQRLLRSPPPGPHYLLPLRRLQDSNLAEPQETGTNPGITCAK